MFVPLASGIFAQEGSVSEETGSLSETETPEEAQSPDPITAFEQQQKLDEGSGGEGAPQTGSQFAASIWSIIRVLLTLAVVAVAIYGIIYFIRRLGRGSTAQDPFLKILASAPLGLNRRAYVLSVGSQAWLVGAAENGVSLISEITDKETLDAMLLEDSRKNAESPAGRFPDFKALLHRLGAPSDSGAPVGPDSIRKRRERLKGL